MLLGVIRLKHSVECFGYYSWLVEMKVHVTAHAIPSVSILIKSVDRATLLVAHIWYQISQFWCASIMDLAFSPGGGVASKTLSGSSNVTVKWTWAFWGGSPTTLCPQSRILNTENLPGLFIPHALSKNVHHTTRPILAVDRNEELIGYVSVKRLPA